MKTYTVLSRRDLIALLAMCDANRNPQQDEPMADTVIVRGECDESPRLQSPDGESIHQLKVPYQYYREGDTQRVTRLTLPPKTGAAPAAAPVTRIAMPGRSAEEHERSRIDTSTMYVRPAFGNL